MEKKLTLREIAPYLPYGLKIQLSEGEIKEIIGIRNWIGWCVVYKDKYGETNIPLSRCKPILRPMSSLTKELYYELSGKSESDSFGFWYGKHTGDNDKREYIYHSGYTCRQYFLCDGYGQFSYKMMDFFFKNHFDVFGLIPAGLATELS